MAIDSSNPYSYQLGGTLGVDAPSYVQRQADEDFYQGLRAGEFCYVLNARQMGKSSLQARTRQRLELEGIRCAMVDVTAIGTTESTAAEWYAGMIDSLVNSFALYDQFDLDEWWASLPLLSPVQRFSKFLELVLLRVVAEPIVIFIDEIDSVRSLPFDADDFFAVIRSLYNLRSTEPRYRRLTFALIGAATPVDLIRDMGRTPFNVGRAIELAGFRLDEADALRVGLGESEGAIAEILEWTGGQPFLTQKLCALVRNAGGFQSTGIADRIAAIVQSQIIDNWEGKDDPVHLRTIRGRVLEVGSAQAGRLLGLYRQVLEQPEGLAGDDSTEEMQLRLSGLVVKRDGRLRVFNRIYREVFDRVWVDGELGKLRPAFYGVAISEWLASGSQDDSRLLRGQALQDARTWAEGKSLGNDDRRFLDASQELEKLDIQKKLAVEEEAKQVLAEANQEAKQLINRGKIALALMIPLAVILGGFSIWSSRQAGIAQSDLGTARKQTESNRVENEKLSNQNQGLSQQVNAAENKILGAKKQEKEAKIREQQASQNLLVAEQRVAEASKQVENLEEKANVASVETENAKRVLESARENLLTAQKEQRIARQDKEETEQFARIEQRGIALLQQPTEQFSKLEALISALEVGQDLARLSKAPVYQGKSLLFNQSSAASATIALRTSLNTITEQNRIKIPDDNYSRAEYSFEKKLIRINSFLFDWSGNHIGSDATINSVFPRNEDETCQRNNEAFLKVSEIPYEICLISSGKVRREQYYKDGYYNRLYDLQSGQFLAQLVGLGGEFSPNGEIFISRNSPYTGSSPNYHFYDLTNIRRAANIQGSYVEFSPNSNYLITYSTRLKNTEPVRLYDKLGKFLLQLKGVSPQFSANNRYIVTHSGDLKDNSTYLYDLSNLDNGLMYLQGNYSNFSPDGRYLAVEVAPLGAVQNGNVLPQNNVRLYDLLNLKTPFRSFDGTMLRFNSDGSYLVTRLESSSKAFVRVYKLSSDEYFDTPLVKDSMSFVHKNFLIVYGREAKSKIYDLRTFPPRLTSIAIGIDQVSGDGQRFLDGTSGDISKNKDIKLFDSSGRELAKLRGNFAQFSSDSQHIVVSAFNDASGDKNYGVSKLYDRSGHMIKEFRGSYATFNRDGKRLLVSSASETSIYDTSGSLLSVYPGIHPALSPDEQYLVTFFPNGTGRMWSLDGGLDDLLKRGCTWLDAYLNNNPDILDRLWTCQTLTKREMSAKSLVIQFEIFRKQTYVPKEDKDRIVQQFLVIQEWNPNLPAKSWNQFCWFGSVNGYATQTLRACEKAVLIEPTNGEYRDSQGLAKALTGNTQGAIDDFRTFIQWLNQYPGYAIERQAQRQRWIDDLQGGKPPSAIFTEEVLEQLRKE